MLASGDKLIVTKEVASFLKEGDIVEIIDVDGDIISFVFGDGLHKGLMNNAEYEAHFKKYEEPKKEAPTVTKEMIDSILDDSDVDVETIFGKCTIVTCKLPNGFVIVESSACVDPENYDESIGIEICLNKIRDRVWELEGYKLQSKLYEEEENECECKYDCDDCDECPCDEECCYCEEDEEEYDDGYFCLYTDLDCDDCKHHDKCWY